LSISTFLTLPNNIQQTNPSNHLGTTSTAVTVMAGLAIAFTPKYTGKIKVYIQCLGINNTAGDGFFWQVAYGTGTAPVNGAAAVGTVIGRGTKSDIQVSSIVLTQTAYVSGLAVGTSYWFDIQQAAITGGTATMLSINCIIEEIQQ